MTRSQFVSMQLTEIADALALLLGEDTPVVVRLRAIAEELRR